MQDPKTMTFVARAAAKDEQLSKIRQHENNEARLKAELAATEAQREKDEAYLVQVALADAAANQLILERYAHHLPPPSPPPPPAPEPAAEETQPAADPAATASPAPAAPAAEPAPAADPAA